MACRRSRVRLPLSPQRRLERSSFAEVAQLVEHQLPKLRVAGSSPVFRSKGLDGSGRRRQPLFLILDLYRESGCAHNGECGAYCFSVAYV